MIYVMCEPRMCASEGAKGIQCRISKSDADIDGEKSERYIYQAVRREYADNDGCYIFKKHRAQNYRERQ